MADAVSNTGGHSMNLNEFLLQAKVSGYASGQPNTRSVLADGGIQYTFTGERLEYTDIYYGSNPFFGQETVREDGRVIWMMNYAGKTDSGSGDEIQDVYTFLRRALRQPDAGLPLRGPVEFSRGKYTYLNTVDGDMDSFFGEELITVNGNPVYRLRYHGGMP